MAGLPQKEGRGGLGCFLDAKFAGKKRKKNRRGDSFLSTGRKKREKKS